MGTDIHVYIFKKNRKTNTWKQVKLYKKDKNRFNIINPYPFRSHEIFEILKEIHCPITLKELPGDFQAKIKECQNTVEYYGFSEINLADLKLYLNKHPKVRDWDYEEDDPKAMKTNPIKFFIKRIERYIDFYDDFWDCSNTYSDIKIIYWFDC